MYSESVTPAKGAQKTQYGNRMYATYLSRDVNSMSRDSRGRAANFTRRRAAVTPDRIFAYFPRFISDFQAGRSLARYVTTMSDQTR